MPRSSYRNTRERRPGCFCAAARQQAGWLLVLYLLAGMGSAWPQTGNSGPPTQTIIARMAQARAKNRSRLRPYVATRDYKLFGKDESKAKSEVIADVAFVPPNFKKYSIEQTNGSGLGQILVRRMLAGEADATKDYASTDVSTDNYNFRFMREEDVGGHRCYVLELLPRRKDKHLLRGSIWVDATTCLLRRFQGELAKSPSWWVRVVSLTLLYGDVGGMWLQTSTEATADVRVLGRATMLSRDVKYKITELVATAPSAETNFLELMPRRPFRPGVIPRPAN